MYLFQVRYLSQLVLQSDMTRPRSYVPLIIYRSSRCILNSFSKAPDQFMSSTDAHEVFMPCPASISARFKVRHDPITNVRPSDNLRKLTMYIFVYESPRYVFFKYGNCRCLYSRSGIYHSWFCSQTRLDHGVLAL